MFHPSDLPPSTQIVLGSLYPSPNLYPKYASFGNGQEIPSKYLDEIRNVQEKCKISWDWMKGDLMLLDNYLICHGRTKFDKDDKGKQIKKNIYLKESI